MKQGLSPRERILAVLITGILGGIITTTASAVDIDTRPGHCPGFSADQIDRIANELGLEAYWPEALEVDCRDNASYRWLSWRPRLQTNRLTSAY